MTYAVRQDITVACRARSCREGIPIVYKLVDDGTYFALFPLDRLSCWLCPIYHPVYKDVIVKVLT